MFGSSGLPDQYASHQDDKERARSLVNEVHGVAAQIRQEAEEQHRLQHHPSTQPRSAKQLFNERMRRGEEQGWMERFVDWAGFRPYLEQRKREDGVHQQRLTWDEDEDHVDRYDYLRAEASKHNPTVREHDDDQADTAEKAHVNSLRAELQQLHARFSNITQRIRTAIHARLASHSPPSAAAESSADQQTQTTPSSVIEEREGDDCAAARVGANDTKSSLPSSPSSAPSHPLLSPLHPLLADVESMTNLPLLPAPPQPESAWQRFMSVFFPSHLEQRASTAYRAAREEAKQEAVRLSSAMQAEYAELKHLLHDLRDDVVLGKGEPLELYEQYNPETVHAADEKHSSA